MKQFDITGYVQNSGQPTIKFSVTVHANDQTSAKRLVQMQYGVGGTVTIQKIIISTKK